MSIANHFYLCTLKGKESSCRFIDKYIAVTVVYRELKKALGLFKITPPIGPDPLPEINEILDGDPDGSPALLFPIEGFSPINTRIQDAKKLQKTLAKISRNLDKNISLLEKSRM